MPLSQDQSRPSTEQATALLLKLELLQVAHGWIVGTRREDSTFVKLLPHGEVAPYTTEQAASAAAKIWQDIRPEYSYSQ